MMILPFKVLFDDVVMPFAAWLPVVLIPEQRLVTLVRDDVVNHLRKLDAINGLASNAKRVISLVGGSRLVPS